MKINVFYENVSFRLRNWRKTRKLIEKVITEEGNFSGDLNFILANDDFILKINREYLKHNWYTDVISFKYDVTEGINGEIFISTDTVKRNAGKYKVPYRDEMLRVIIHGVLHICGYDDRNVKEKDHMHDREDYWMKRFYREQYGF